MAETAAPSDLRRAAAAILQWYAEAGVDLAVDEVAPNHLQGDDLHAAPAGGLAPQAALPAQTAVAAPAPIERAAPPEQAAGAARDLARAARSLDDLARRMATFEGCALKRSAQRLVFADGVPGAPVMLIGEAPGREEDEIGRPFVGRAGMLLDRMLSAIGLDRSTVHIANIVPWRPPGNRTPTPQELAICLPFIERQIELAAPAILVCLGAPATQTLLRQKDGILRLRGRWIDYRAADRTIPALATLHPAFLLRQPLQKRLAWRDLLALRGRLGEISRAAQA